MTTFKYIKNGNDVKVNFDDRQLFKWQSNWIPNEASIIVPNGSGISYKWINISVDDIPVVDNEMNYRAMDTAFYRVDIGLSDPQYVYIYSSDENEDYVLYDVEDSAGEHLYEFYKTNHEYEYDKTSEELSLEPGIDEGLLLLTPSLNSASDFKYKVTKYSNVDSSLDGLSDYEAWVSSHDGELLFDSITNTITD